jgi:hypothetical protein
MWDDSLARIYRFDANGLHEAICFLKATQRPLSRRLIVVFQKESKQAPGR